MHVNDLLCLDDDGRLRLLFETTAALQRHAQLIHHGAAERSLQGGGDRKEGNVTAGVTLFSALLNAMQLCKNITIHPMSAFFKSILNIAVCCMMETLTDNYNVLKYVMKPCFFLPIYNVSVFIS